MKESPCFQNQCWSGLRRLQHDRVPRERSQASSQRGLSIRWTHKRGHRTIRILSKRGGGPGWKTIELLCGPASRTIDHNFEMVRSMSDQANAGGGAGRDNNGAISMQTVDQTVARQEAVSAQKEAAALTAVFNSAEGFRQLIRWVPKSSPIRVGSVAYRQNCVLK